MLRLTFASAFLLVLVSGCGLDSGSESGSDSGSDSGAGKSSAEEEPEASASAEPGFFLRADSDAINKTAATAQQALATAYTQRAQKRCNARVSEGYPAWRMCWHQALDPVEQGLTALSTEMERLAGKDFPEKCVEQLTSAAATFEGMRGKVGALLTGIDSDERASQVRAMKTYNADLLAVGRGFSPTFRSLTRVCYSPDDLASINASPSPSPSGQD